MMVAARSSNRFAPKAGASGPARGMARAQGAWGARLRPDLEPRVVADVRHGGSVLIATPLLIAAEVAAIRRGQVITVSELRARLARRFGADRTCPLTTGIFASIVAGAVSEDLTRSRKARWPIWRLVGDDGRLHPKWPLAARFRASQLREEGQRVMQHGTGWKVLLSSPGAR
jgi:hypothetical protein